MASEFTARIKAELDLNGVESKLASLGKKHKINLALETRSLDSQIASVKSKLESLSKIKIDLGVKNANGGAAKSGEKTGKDFASSMVKRINSQISNGGIEASIAKVTAQYEKLGSTGHAKLGSIKKDIEQLNSLQAKLGNSTSQEELVKNYSEFNNTLQRVKNNLTTVSAEAKTVANALQIKTLDNQIETWMNNNTRAAKTYGETIKNLRGQLSGKSSMRLSEFSDIENQFKSIKVAASAAGKTGNGFATSLTRAFGRLSSYVSVSTIIYGAINTAKQMYASVVDIDTAMTELRKVSDASSSQLSSAFENSKTSAREYATVLSDIISATADWSRLGYDIDQSQQLAKVAALYKNVGDDIDIATANESLISTFKGFNMGVEDAVGIVDRFNEVSNNFAISSDGIGQALQRSASSMSAANNSLDESIALITAANTVVQDPDSVGTAFKTISMRIRGASTELEQAGLDTDGMATSTAKLREEIKALSGVDIMLDNNSFKSTYQIMDELSQKWSDLTDIQQASITELIAGKRQGNIVSSLMENFDIAREALNTSRNSQGSAARENEKYLDSIQGRVANLRSSFQELSSVTIDSGMVKTAVSGFTEVLDVITKVVDTFGLLPSLMGGAAIGAFVKNFACYNSY